MDTRLKHRIVGSLVLLALAVIFLPEFLDGDKAYRQPNFAPMPDSPQITTQAPEVVFLEPEVKSHNKQVEQEASQPVEIASNVAEQATTAEVQKRVAEDPEAGDTRLEQYKDNAWVIQLGMFRNRENVIKLVTQLRQEGYPTFTKPSRPVSGEPTRVVCWAGSE